MKTIWAWGLWIFGGLVALAGLAALGLYLLVAQIDVRKEVERAVEGATGRQLTLNGDVGVSYWPVLGLHAEGAALENVEGGRAQDFLTAVDIHVGVEIWPLLRREVVVRELVLQQPKIFLEVDAEGKPNWMLAAPAAPTPQPAPAPGGATRPPAVEVARATLRKLSIVDGEVNFHDARRAAGWVVGDVDISSDLSDLDRPMRVAGDVLFNDKPVAVELEIARLGAAMRGEQTSLKLHLSSDLLEARFEGQTLAASGELAGAITASGPSLRQLAAWANTPFQGGVGFEQFEVSGRLEIGGGRYDFTNADFALDRISGSGDFALSQHNGKPYLSGLLRLAEFDLNPYLTGQAPPPAEAKEGAPAGAELAVVAAPPRALDVVAAPTAGAIDFSGLRAFNADLDLRTQTVLVQRMRIDSARLNLVINDGFLAATLHEMRLYGGSGSGRFELDSRGPAPRIVQELAFSNLEARRFLSDAVNFSNIEGRAEVSLTLRTQGRTQTEMIAAADGGAHIEVITGALHGVDLGGVSRTIRNALRGELIAPEARTPFLGFSATFAVADGVLASDDLSFNTADLRIPGIGVIDLPQRRADLRLAPRSSRGGIVFPFSIRGPWGQSTYAGDFNGRVQGEVLARVRQVETAARAPVN